MGEERGRQSGGAAAGGLPADVWSEVGLSGRLLVEDEEKLFALLVSPLFEEDPPLDRDASGPSLDSPLQVHPSSNRNPCRGHFVAAELS